VLQRAHSAQAAQQHPHLLQRRLLYQNRKDDADPMAAITVQVRHALAEMLQRMPMAPKNPNSDPHLLQRRLHKPIRDFRDCHVLHMSSTCEMWGGEPVRSQTGLAAPPAQLMDAA